MSYEDPYIVIGAVLLLLLFLLYIRHILSTVRRRPEVLIGNAQMIGERNEQEDSFATVVNKNGVLAVLADGMGGYSNGKFASHFVVNTFVREFGKTENINPIDCFLRDTAFLSNNKLLARVKGTKTGTTVVVVVISEGYLHWASIGDSAIALFRNGQLINLNKKHTFQSILDEQYLSGAISKAELMNHPRKKRLTNYIGHEGFRDVELNNRYFKLVQGDKVILFSDGVYNSITEMEIEEILIKKIPPYEAADAIMNAIRSKRLSHQDNASIIILEKNNSE